MCFHLWVLEERREEVEIKFQEGSSREGESGAESKERGVLRGAGERDGPVVGEGRGGEHRAWTRHHLCTLSSHHLRTLETYLCN